MLEVFTPIDKYKSLVNPNELIDIFVSYYGEEFRKQIENRINATKVFFLPTDMVGHNIMAYLTDEMKTKGDLSDKITAVKNLLMHFQINEFRHPANLVLHSEALKDLGFDINNIVKKVNGEWRVFGNNELTKLINLLNYFLEKSNNNVNDLTSSDGYKRTLQNFIEKCNHKSDPPLLRVDESQVSYYLYELVDTKFPLKDMLKYDKRIQDKFVSAVKNLFGIDCKSMKDLFEFNKTMANFAMEMFTTTNNNHRDTKSKIDNINKNRIVNLINCKHGPRVANYTKTYFTEHEKVNHLGTCRTVQEPDGNYIHVYIEISEKTTYETILHEFNHAIQSHIRGPLLYCGVGTKPEFRYLYEIINDYLTIKAMNNSASKINKPIKLYDSFLYENGVILLSELLEKHEEVLKKNILLPSGEDILVAFGPNNFVELAHFIDKYMKYCQNGENHVLRQEINNLTHRQYQNDKQIMKDANLLQDLNAGIHTKDFIYTLSQIDNISHAIINTDWTT